MKVKTFAAGKKDVAKVVITHNRIKYTITQDVVKGLRINKSSEDSLSSKITMQPAYTNEIIVI
jgi:hypothetical protein